MSSSWRCGAARLVGVETPSGPATIVADDGVITEIRPGHPSVDCAVVGDGSDVVAPGLIDVHTHGAVGVQAIDGDVEGLRRLGAFYASHGVTSYLATIGGSDTSIVSGLDGVRTLMDDAGTPPGRGASACTSRVRSSARAARVRSTRPRSSPRTSRRSSGTPLGRGGRCAT